MNNTIKFLKASKSLILVCLLILSALMFKFDSAAALVPVANGGGGGTGTGSTSTSTGCDPSTDGDCSACANISDGTASGTTDNTDDTDDSSPSSNCVACNGSDGCADSAIKCGDSGCNLIEKYINPSIQFFSVAFGLICVMSILIGAVNFVTSEGDPQKASKAKTRIARTIFAIFMYLFLYAFLEFIVPGGLFNNRGI
jgi:hypothetical protein